MYPTIRLSIPVSDEDLERVSEENPGWKIERDSRGGLVMSPTTSSGGAKSSALNHQIFVFAARVGGKSFDSSTGFTLPDNSVLSPDAAWISEGRWSALTPKARDSYAPIVPDVWIELLSKTDNRLVLQAKLQRIKAFGARYVLLVDPYERTLWSEGEPPDGFVLDDEAIFDA
jgi:Uma2 family endonuclease